MVAVSSHPFSKTGHAVELLVAFAREGKSDAVRKACVVAIPVKMPEIACGFSGPPPEWMLTTSKGFRRFATEELEAALRVSDQFVELAEDGRETARLEFEEAALALASGDRAETTFYWGRLGEAYKTRGELEKALGTAYKDRDDIEKALECFGEHLRGTREGQYHVGTARALAYLSQIHRMLGNPTVALECHEARERVASNDPREQAKRMHDRGKCLADLGDYDGAEKALRVFLKAAQENGWKSDEAVGFGALGNLYFKRADYAKAAHCHRKDWEISCGCGDGPAMTSANYNLDMSLRRLDQAHRE